MPRHHHYRGRRFWFAPIWWFILFGCPTLILLAYKMGFRLER